MKPAKSKETDLKQPELRTRRLLLRPFRANDAADVRVIVDNDSIASTTRTIDLPFTESMAQSWIQPQAENWRTQCAVVYAICFNPLADTTTESMLTEPALTEPTLVGAVGLEINDEDDRAELGYWVAEDYWGRGIATEASKKMLNFGFDMLRLNKVVAFHMARNPASGRVLEKLGMRKEGFFQQHVKKWGQFEDVVAYGILQSDPIRSRPDETPQ